MPRCGAGKAGQILGDNFLGSQAIASEQQKRIDLPETFAGISVLELGAEI